MTPKRYAIIPTHNRHEQLLSLVHSLEDQCDHVIILDNASDPEVTLMYFALHGVRAPAFVMLDSEQPPNLSRLWNRGIDTVREVATTLGETAWDLAIFNDDAVVPAGWFDYVVGALRSHPTAAVACTNPYGINHEPLFKTKPDRDITTRMCPWAFVTRGELGLRADPQLRWWWGDTDWDWNARAAGGVLVLPGFHVQNTGANSSTHGELAEQAGHDGRTFEQKWGIRPW